MDRLILLWASRLILPMALALGHAVAGQDVPGQQPPPLPEDTLPEDLFPTRPVPGLLALIAPRNNALTRTSFDLGRKLFFDPILSADRSVSCATCHQPGHGFSTPERFPPGVFGHRAKRNAPTLYNRGYGNLHGWDGRANSLEQRVLLPIADENEMGLPVEEAVSRLHEHEEYRRRFDLSYRGGVTSTNLAKALASFVRGLLLGDSPVDSFQTGEVAKLTSQEKAGLWIYESKGRCWQCHSGRNYSDEKFHNTGIGALDGIPEDGRFGITGSEQDRGRFKTPTLRGVVETAPYMHDGSLATLQEVVEFYAAGGNRNRSLSEKLRPLDLSKQDRENLVAFLMALSRRN